MSTSQTTHTPEELAELEHLSGLVFVGYVSAGEPRTLVPMLVKRERWPERRRLVLVANQRRQEEPKECAA